jgi:hypothetical protein
VHSDHARMRCFIYSAAFLEMMSTCLFQNTFGTRTPSGDQAPTLQPFAAVVTCVDLKPRPGGPFRSLLLRDCS